MHIDSDRPPLNERAALVDRRSLSEAWYNALHFAERAGSAQSPATAHGRAVAGARGKRASGNSNAGAAPVPPGRPIASRPGPRAHLLPPVAAMRVRAPAVPRTQPPAIERAGLRGAGATIAFGKTRVAVFVRRAREGVRVVALCSPREEAAVRRALAHAQASGASLVRCDVVAIGAGR